MKTLRWAMLILIVLLTSCNGARNTEAPTGTPTVTQTPEPTTLTLSTSTIIPISSLTSTPTVTLTTQITSAHTQTPVPTIIPKTGYEIWQGLQFDTKKWTSIELSESSTIFKEGIQLAHWHNGPALLHKSIRGCVLSIEPGHGLTDEWSYDSEIVMFEGFYFGKRSFYPVGGQVAFIVYNGEFLVNFPAGSEDVCIHDVEEVLATYQIINLP